MLNWRLALLVLVAASGGAAATTAPTTRTVVYICEASEGAKPNFDCIREAVQHSMVNCARNGQAFNLIVYSSGKATALFDGQLRVADSASAARAHAFLERMTLGGENDPTEAIRMAAGLRPQTVFLLVASPLTDEPGLVKLTASLRPQGWARLNVVQMVPDDQGKQRIGYALARSNDGIWRRSPRSRSIQLVTGSEALPEAARAWARVHATTRPRIAPPLSNVILVQNPPVACWKEPMLLTLEAEQSLRKFMESTKPQPKVSLLPALELALSQHPDYIHIFVAGSFDDLDRVLPRLQELMKERKTYVEAFISTSDAVTIKALRAACKHTGGRLLILPPENPDRR